MNRSNWLCLDCGKSTFENNADYYMLQNRLWRRLVPREQRHGMLCRACVEGRLGRPLAPEDFRNRATDDGPDPDDQPMREEDYGIIDSLTPEMLQAVDAAMIEFTSSRPRQVIVLVRHIYYSSSVAIPGLPDWFYFDRVGELVEHGVLIVVDEGEDLRSHWVKAADCLPGNQ